MNDSWTFVAILIVVALLPFALLAAVRLAARVVPANAHWLAEIERRHHRSYWGVFALLYVVAGVGHFARGNGEPLFGALFLMMGVAAAIKGARKPRAYAS
jgi:hypothetical protein